MLFSAYKLGEYVLKIGSHKLVSNCANTEEILQPFIRNQFGRVYIEVLPFLRTKNLDLAKIEKVRENLIRKKIDSSDLGDNNFGVLEHPVKFVFSSSKCCFRFFWTRSGKRLFNRGFV